MKLKTDFITNSSSASINLYITLKKSYTPDEFIDWLGQVTEPINYLKEISDLRFFEPNIVQLNSRTYRLEDHTSMFNTYKDVPFLFIHIICSMTEIRKGTIFDQVKHVKLEVVPDHY